MPVTPKREETNLWGGIVGGYEVPAPEMTPAQSLVRGNDFWRVSDKERKEKLAGIDPKFASLPQDSQNMVLGRLREARLRGELSPVGPTDFRLLTSKNIMDGLTFIGLDTPEAAKELLPKPGETPEQAAQRNFSQEWRRGLARAASSMTGKEGMMFGAAGYMMTVPKLMVLMRTAMGLLGLGTMAVGTPRFVTGTKKALSGEEFTPEAAENLFGGGAQIATGAIMSSIPAFRLYTKMLEKFAKEEMPEVAVAGSLNPAGSKHPLTFLQKTMTAMREMLLDEDRLGIHIRKPSPKDVTRGSELSQDLGIINTAKTIAKASLTRLWDGFINATPQLWPKKFDPRSPNGGYDYFFKLAHKIAKERPTMPDETELQALDEALESIFWAKAQRVQIPGQTITLPPSKGGGTVTKPGRTEFSIEPQRGDLTYGRLNDALSNLNAFERSAGLYSKWNSDTRTLRQKDLLVDVLEKLGNSIRTELGNAGAFMGEREKYGAVREVLDSIEKMEKAFLSGEFAEVKGLGIPAQMHRGLAYLGAGTIGTVFGGQRAIQTLYGAELTAQALQREARKLPRLLADGFKLARHERLGERMPAEQFLKQQRVRDALRERAGQVLGPAIAGTDPKGQIIEDINRRYITIKNLREQSDEPPF